MTFTPKPFAAATGLALAATLALPASAQEALDPAVVTETLPVPEVSALQAPSERVGEYLEAEDGARIFYEAAGDGPPMLLLHGYPLSGALFARVRDALQDEYTVITVDHRGYGLSEAPEVPELIVTHASDALAVMDALEIEEAVVGGMSMGGPIALSMYDMAPERFTGLVLIDTIAAPADPPEAGLWRGVAEVARGGGAEALIPALIPDMLTGATQLAEPEVADYLAEVMRGASEDAAVGGATALAERPDFTGLLPQIDVPTLVLIGLEDSLYVLRVSRDMAEAIPDATLAIVPDAAHAAIFEAPGHAAAAIQTWAAEELG